MNDRGEIAFAVKFTDDDGIRRGATFQSRRATPWPPLGLGLAQLVHAGRRGWSETPNRHSSHSRSHGIYLLSVDRPATTRPAKPVP